MAKRKTKTSVKRQSREHDGTYLLKLVLVLLLATLWLKFRDPILIGHVPLIGIPLGTIVGLFLIHRYETINEDRKIWFAIILLTTVVCLFAPIGVLV